MLKHRGPKKLKSIIENCALKCMKSKLSKNEIRLILNWRSIVGEEIAKCTKPKKISYAQNINSGILHLVVTNDRKALEIQHIVSLLIEKITIFFGYKAVYDIKIKQESIDYFATLR
ncbi:MAG: DciA family protein [Wolbachia sp.]